MDSNAGAKAPAYLEADAIPLVDFDFFGRSGGWLFCFEAFYGDEEGVGGDRGAVVGAQHQGNVDHRGDAEADKPGVLVQEMNHGDEEADESNHHPGGEGDEGAEIDAAGVLVRALADIETFEIERLRTDDEVVRDHDAGDGAEKAGVADQPAEDVGGEVG